MNRVPRHNLRVLIALALTLACKEPPADTGEDFLKPPPAPEKTGPALFKGSGKSLPRDGEIKGWRLKEGPAYYDSSTLFEVINGAASGYLAYGFVSLAKADYRPDGITYAEDIVVEIYRMKTALAAFGKYSEERSSCDKPSDDPRPGCSRGSDRIFHKGEHFVRVVTYDDSPSAVEELGRVASAVAAKMTGKSEPPAAALQLPSEGQKANSVVYKPRNMLGIDALGNGFQADYVEAEDEYSLFVKPIAGGVEKSIEAFAKLRRALNQPGLAKEGVKPLPIAGLGDEATALQTNYGWILCLRSGSTILGAVEADSQATAEKQARRLLTHE